MWVLLKEGLWRPSASLCLAVGLLAGCDGWWDDETPDTDAEMVQVSITVSSGGEVELASAEVEVGQSAALRLVPENGYRLDSLTGCGGVLEGEHYITPALSADCAVDVRFVADDDSGDYALVKARAGANGRMVPEILNVPADGEAVFTAEPASGYHLNAVSGCGAVFSGNTIYAPGDSSPCVVNATFAVGDEPATGYRVSTVAPAGVTFTPVQADVWAGQVTHVQLQLADGYELTGFSGCGDNGEPHVVRLAAGGVYRTPPVTEDCTLTAEVRQRDYQVTVVGADGGNVEPLTARVAHGQTRTFTLTPAWGFAVATGTGCDGSLSGNVYTTGPITADCDVRFTYVSTAVRITTAVSGNGSIIPSESTVLPGERATFELGPAGGYEIDSVSGCGGSLSGNVYTTAPVTGACAVTASFNLRSYAVTASGGSGGSISPATQNISHGQSGQVTLTPEAGYEIASVSGCGGSLSGNVYTTAPVTGACAVTASFNLRSYAVTASGGSGGSISPATQNISHGQSGQVTLTPEAGYEIASVSGCGGSLSGNVYTTAPVTAACAITATFSLRSYAVTASGGSGGSISPATQDISHGQSGQVTLSPEAGYEIDSVSGCSGSLSGNVYTTAPVTDACEVTATFSLNLSSPANVQVAVGDGVLSLTWDGVANAQSYVVYSAEEVGVNAANYHLLAGGRRELVSSTSATLSSLNNAVTYYLVVAAAIGADEGPLSASVSAEPVAATPVITGKLNDTGHTSCSNSSQNYLNCPVAGFEGQDGEHGRDVSHNDNSDGRAGFSFTKLDGHGNPLPASASDWRCVKDNVTGLIWEIKTNDGGLRDMNHTYTWYNSDPATNGGSVGVQNGGSCYSAGRCDTEKFVADVNAVGLCGARDWRMPAIEELLSIVDYNRLAPAIDTAWFPNTSAYAVCSATPFEGYSWALDLSYGYAHDYHNNDARRVRLVRGGP